MRRCTLHGRKNILKRLLIHVGAFNISLVMRKMLGAGKPRELANRVAELISGASKRLINLFGYKGADNFNHRSANAPRLTAQSISFRWKIGWKIVSCTTGS
jgi:hypothetical protein